MGSRLERLGKIEARLALITQAGETPAETPVEWSSRIALAAHGIASLDPWQRDLLASRARRICTLTTRQAGKTETCSLLAAHVAIRGGLALIVSPTQRQSGIMHGRVHAALLADRQPMVNESATETRLANGGSVIALPGDRPSGIRGHNLAVFPRPAALILDEAAFVRDDLAAVVLPMLAVAPQAQFIMLSTPAAPVGLFHDVATGNDPEWEHYRVTADECPRISLKHLDSERRRLGDLAFRREYYCEFHGSAAAVLSPEDIAAMFAPKAVEAPGEMMPAIDLDRATRTPSPPTGPQSSWRAW